MGGERVALHVAAAAHRVGSAGTQSRRGRPAALAEPSQSPFAQAAAEDERKSRHTVALAFVGVLLLVLALAIVYLVLPYLKDLRRALSQ